MRHYVGFSQIGSHLSSSLFALCKTQLFVSSCPDVFCDYIAIPCIMYILNSKIHGQINPYTFTYVIFAKVTVKGHTRIVNSNPLIFFSSHWLCYILLLQQFCLKWYNFCHTSYDILMCKYVHSYHEPRQWFIIGIDWKFRENS